MKRLFPLITLILLACILASDFGLIAKYQQGKSAFQLADLDLIVSPIHHLILNSWGIGFAYTKGVITTLLMALWIWQLISPSKITILRYITIIYSLTWALIGLLMITGIVGIIQFSVGIPIKPYDISVLTDIGLIKLFLFFLIEVFIPLSLVLIPQFHNRYNQR